MRIRILKHFALFIGALFFWMSSFGQGRLQLLPGTQKIYAIQNNVHRLVGSVSFEYQGNTMYCDSAHYNDKAKEVRAYGNVHIQKNGVNLYADSIYYSERQKFAKLWGHVRARDNAYKMIADSMDYDAKKGRAIFRSSGSISSTVSDEKITCLRGYFYPSNGSFFFSGEVHYTKADLDVKSDTLQFAYEQQKLYFMGNTQMRNDSTQLFCENGWYDLEHQTGALFNHAQIFEKNNILKGDTLFINTKLNDFEGRGDVYYKDVDQNIALLGNKAIYSSSNHYAYVCGNSLCFIKYKQDTLFLHSDTLYLEKDSLNKSQFLYGHKNFRFLHPTLQGIGDSTRFCFELQTLEINKNPIMWSQRGELKGAQAIVFFKDSLLKQIELKDNATVLLELQKDSLYNQMAAKHIYALFDTSGVLSSVDAEGQAKTIFYPETSKKVNDTLIEQRREGLNRLIAEQLHLDLKNGEVTQISYLHHPDGVFYPMDKIDQKERWIQGFNWNPDLRPTNPNFLRKD